MTCRILSYVEKYLLARDVTPGYAQKVRHRIGDFVAFCGNIPIDTLDSDQGNTWLAEVATRGHSKRTVYDYRAILLAVWTDAFELGFNDHPPRLRRISKPRPLVEAYTMAEIRQLLDQAYILDGRHKDGNKRSDFWQSALHVGYACGPRRGDLLRIKKRQLRADGALTFLQNKTGYAVTVQLPPVALQLLERLDGDNLLPWPYKTDWFSKAFRTLRKDAGVTRGSFKWVRRSAGSYAERECRGRGSQLLGHRDPRVFEVYYRDRSITDVEPIMAPPLPI